MKKDDGSSDDENSIKRSSSKDNVTEDTSKNIPVVDLEEELNLEELIKQKVKSIVT